MVYRRLGLPRSLVTEFGISLSTGGSGGGASVVVLLGKDEVLVGRIRIRFR